MVHDFMGVGVGQQSWVVVVNDSPLRVSPSDRVCVKGLAHVCVMTHSCVS